MIGSAPTKVLDRAALATLCLLLAAAMAMRAFADQGAAPATEGAGEGETVDLGSGVALPRAATARRELSLPGCRTPVTIDFIEPSPHNRDASLAAPPHPDDRVYYAYRGWKLGGRLAVTEVSALYFAWRAAAVLRLEGARGRDSLAVKMSVPAACKAGPDDALAALRRDVLARR